MSATRIHSSVTSLSWIPSEAVTGVNKAIFGTGFTHYDAPPPDRIDDLEKLRAADTFRFANHLAAWIDVVDGRIVDAGYAGGCVMGSTTVGLAGKQATFAGVSFAKLDAMGSVQWPCNDANPMGSPVMHATTFARGKGKFMMTEYVPTDERTGPRFPLLLTTGRTLSQYNVGAQTRRTDNVVWHDEDRLEIHPHDAEQRGVKDGDWVRITSRAGETALRALITDRVATGVVYTTFHHPLTQANVITTDYSDWATNCPEYKVTAVQIGLSNGPTRYQEDYEAFAEASRRIAPAEAAE